MSRISLIAINNAGTDPGFEPGLLASASLWLCALAPDAHQSRSLLSLGRLGTCAQSGCRIDTFDRRRFNHVNFLTMLGWLHSALGGPCAHAPSIPAAADPVVTTALA